MSVPGPDVTAIEREVERHRQEKDRLRSEVAEQRRKIEEKKASIENLQAEMDAQRSALTELVTLHSDLQTRHNREIEAVQESSERLVLARRKASSAPSKTILSGTPKAALPRRLSTEVDGRTEEDDVYRLVAEKVELGNDLSQHCPKALLLRLGGLEGRDTTNGPDHTVLFRNAWKRRHAKLCPDLPRIGWRRGVWEGYAEVPGTVFGEGNGFHLALDNSVWQVVGDPVEASIVWERDGLEAFRTEKFDPRRQLLNRLSSHLEILLVDKGALGSLADKLGSLVRVPDTHVLSNAGDFLHFATRVAPRMVKGAEGIKYILKRANLASGFGMQIVEDFPEWWARRGQAELLACMRDRAHTFIIQRYIRDPLLLKLPGDTVGRKFDLRCYFVIASVDPLVAYFRLGTIRMNIEQYRDADFNNPHVHISNIAQQRTHRNYPFLQNSLKMLSSDLSKHVPAAAYQNIVSSMKTAVRSILLARKSELRADAGNGRFALLACDFIIDTQYQTYLLELQSGPALSQDDDVSKWFIPELINDTVSIAHEVLRRKMNGESLRGLRCIGAFDELLN
eukprot:gene6813-10441_t